ncbi:amino acid oxidase [Streptomyces noursei]|uniref:D-amino-acid oxidase n=2 Tax=Streptomyces noursei TaxID=1971 RepID=A0A401RBF0_STRNR|nr:amino acid oxidase [Streptomyces noursei]
MGSQDGGPIRRRNPGRRVDGQEGGADHGPGTRRDHGEQATGPQEGTEMTERRSVATGGATAPEICVIGGGVIGLTSAVVLAEAGYRVRVVARDTAGDTTSAVAGGLCWPYRIQPYDEAVRWSLRSLEVLGELAGRPAETGARLVTGTFASAPAADGGDAGLEAGLDAWYAALPGLRRARAGELPAGCTAGWRARTPLVDMPVHLGHLERRLVAAGGTVVTGAVASLAEAADGVRAVVNCSGLGARELVPDASVHPVQGQLVIVENPGVTEWFTAADAGAEDTAYVLPQPFGLVLGGTAREGPGRGSRTRRWRRRSWRGAPGTSPRWRGPACWRTGWGCGRPVRRCGWRPSGCRTGRCACTTTGTGVRG